MSYAACDDAVSREGVVGRRPAGGRGPMRTSKRLAALIAVVALVATACTGGGGNNQSSSSSSNGAVKTGGHLILGTLSNIDTLNPFVTFQQNSYSTFEYIYPQLVQYDLKSLEFVPDFAEKWESSTDGLTWTFHTVPNAKWSDGQPLTANDAAFTFGTILKYGDGPAANLSGGLTHVTKVEASDDNTLVITYSAPVANVLSNLQQLSILPQHVWAQYAVGDGKALRQFPNEPTDQPLVSGGPFELAQYKKDQVVIFQTNPNFYGAKPAIDGFGLQYFSNDDSMVAALQNGQIQAAINVPVTAVEALKGNSSLTVYNGPGITLRDFIINSSPEKTTNLELLDPKVRMAMEYAIDRDTIVKTAWLGYAEPGSTIVAPGTGDWHDSQIQGLPFDIDKANALLDQAGYTKGTDGIRVANGHPMSYTVLFASDETGAGDAAFRIIQNGFQQIGIQITQRKMDNDAVNSAILGDNNTYNQFDLAMWDWFPLVDPDFILSVLTSAQWGGWSDTGYDNPTYDKLYQEQGLAIDPAKRLQIVHQMQQIAFDDRPYIILNYNQVIDVWSNDWAGFGDTESVLGLLNNLSKAPFTQVHQA
jgi:peptide/nickel transport system substrate-binding protein